MFKNEKKSSQEFICVECGSKYDSAAALEDDGICVSCHEKKRQSEKTNVNRSDQSEKAQVGGVDNNDDGSSFVRVSDIYMKFRNVANSDEIYGEKLPSLINAFKTLRKENAPDEEIEKAFNNLTKELNRTILVVPVHLDPSEEFQGDRVFHCSENAARRINIDSIVFRCNKMTVSQTARLFWTLKDERLTIDYDWWDVSRISGSEGFRFGESGVPLKIYPYIPGDGKNRFFLCFSGVDQLMKVYGRDKNLHVALFTLTDVVKFMYSFDDIIGLIINPDTETHCFLEKRFFSPG